MGRIWFIGVPRRIPLAHGTKNDDGLPVRRQRENSPECVIRDNPYGLTGIRVDHPSALAASDRPQFMPFEHVTLKRKSREEYGVKGHSPDSPSTGLNALIVEGSL